MSEINDAAAVAEKLTPAQRRALMWLPEDGSARAHAGAVAGGLTSMRRKWRDLLVKAVWNHGDDAHRYSATATGLAVRAHLQEEGGAP